MGKGCCNKTKTEKEPSIHSSKKNNPSAKTSSTKTSSSSSSYKKKANHADNLLLYQKTMAMDPSNKSLTKKILTKEMAQDNSNIRGNAGEGLGHCVYPNVNNTMCLYPYATTPDCYNVFADFFGEIVEHIHGVPTGECSLIPYFGKLKNHGLTNLNSFDRKRQRAIYSDIIIRRNIENIAFTPKMSKSERNKVISNIEPKIRSIFENSDELAEIPLEWENRINSIKDDLDDCNAMAGYPDGRLMLVFKNYNKVYEGCILNFDDHIQHIVSTNDGRIGELFTRMHYIISHKNLEDINYSAHTIYGHLTLSPLYVGTGFTIRVLARLPFVSRLSDTDSLIKQFDCATKKEIDNVNNGMIFIYSTKSLNKTECEIFKDMVLAFNKLSALEDELELVTPMSVQEDVMSVEKLKTLMKKINKSESKSYTKKFLTDELAKQYDGQKTKFGTLINNCIRHNAFYPKSLFPRACDSDCYAVFQTFFNPILLQTNNTNGFRHNTVPDYGTTIGNKLYKLQHPDIYSYRVRFCRNFEKLPFPSMMSNCQRYEIERIMIRLFDEFPVEIEGDYIPLDMIKKSIYYEDIMKYKFLPSHNDVDSSSGLYNSWPAFRGIYFLKRNINYPNIYVVILVNFSDHIKVISFDPCGRSLDICYKRAVDVMKFLELRFIKSFASKIGYGFLTSMPNSVGCGMRVSALIKLRNLGKKREIFEQQCIALQFAYRGTAGHGTVAADQVFDVSIKMNLNVTEKWVIMMFTQRLKDLILTERQYDPRIEKPTNCDPLDDDDNFEEEVVNLDNQQPEQLSSKTRSVKSNQQNDQTDIEEVNEQNESEKIE